MVLLCAPSQPHHRLRPPRVVVDQERQKRPAGSEEAQGFKGWLRSGELPGPSCSQQFERFDFRERRWPFFLITERLQFLGAANDKQTALARVHGGS